MQFECDVGLKFVSIRLESNHTIFAFRSTKKNDARKNTIVTGSMIGSMSSRIDRSHVKALLRAQQHYLTVEAYVLCLTGVLFIVMVLLVLHRKGCRARPVRVVMDDNCHDVSKPVTSLEAFCHASDSRNAVIGVTQDSERRRMPVLVIHP